jgi:hypothetical protein
MIGLFFSLAMLYAAAAVLGFVAGWQIFARLEDERRRSGEAEIEQLRAALSEARVRRARAA